jgi:L-seryl-tRNA(Ser) seleniumtransferase
MNESKKSLLRHLPGVDTIIDRLKCDPAVSSIPGRVLASAVRSAIDMERKAILETGSIRDQIDAQILQQAEKFAREAMAPNLRRVVNATGVIVHTNMGRSLLPDDVLGQIVRISNRYSNLEFDLARGKRGSRYSHVEDIICEISGAEAALVVNNNAGAVFLALETIAKNREVIVSRGELVEIGGSFRVPDVMAKSGGILKEVGTTNRTHLRDYENAVSEQTALLLKVHQSNFNIVGFTTEVSLPELVKLGARRNLPVMEDLGSGNFIDFSRYGLHREPTVQESVTAGADLVTFSGDKLLGGPQAGIIVGKKEMVDRIKRNPLNRALRIDKMTLAGLEATIRLYLDPEKAVERIPTLRMLTLSLEETQERAARLSRLFDSLTDQRLDIRQVVLSSRAGGGAMPTMDLPSCCVGIRVLGMSANFLEATLRNHSTPIIGRIEEDSFFIDTRTLQEDEYDIIHQAFQKLLEDLP